MAVYGDLWWHKPISPLFISQAWYGRYGMVERKYVDRILWCMVKQMNIFYDTFPAFPGSTPCMPEEVSACGPVQQEQQWQWGPSSRPWGYPEFISNISLVLWSKSSICSTICFLEFDEMVWFGLLEACLSTRVSLWCRMTSQPRGEAQRGRCRQATCAFFF